MSVRIEQIDRIKTRELILAAQSGSLGEGEVRTLDSCLSLSAQIWVGYVRGELVCAWGLIPPSLLADEAYLWLYHTSAVEEFKFLFVRHSQRVIEEMLKLYPRITGITNISSRDSIRWLRWLGAKFGNPGPKYIPFEIVKHG